jgi:hypothetical protein
MTLAKESGCAAPSSQRSGRGFRQPIPVSDPLREAAVIARFKRGLGYIAQHYLIARRLGLDKRTFNESLARLQAAVARPRQVGVPESRLHPRLEIAINKRARELAGLAPDALLGDDHEPFVQQAARDVAKRTTAMRGRPGEALLLYHVEALMALIRETTGAPVLARKINDYFYEPELLGEQGEMIRSFVARLEPDVSEATLVRWVRAARSKYAGRPMRFRDYCPGFDAKPDAETGLPVLAAPHRLERLEISAPIYCP